MDTLYEEMEKKESVSEFSNQSQPLSTTESLKVITSPFFSILTIKNILSDQHKVKATLYAEDKNLPLA